MTIEQFIFISFIPFAIISVFISGYNVPFSNKPFEELTIEEFRLKKKHLDKQGDRALLFMILWVVCILLELKFRFFIEI